MYTSANGFLSKPQRQRQRERHQTKCVMRGGLALPVRFKS